VNLLCRDNLEEGPLPGFEAARFDGAAAATWFDDGVVVGGSWGSATDEVTIGTYVLSLPVQAAGWTAGHR
jgi:hypothetical protein